MLSLIHISRFLSVDNILSVLRQISMLCIMACGVTFVMISGGLDLSVGSMCSIATVFWALGMTDWGLPQWAAILLYVYKRQVLRGARPADPVSCRRRGRGRF